MEDCREPGCDGTMTINKKGVYVCPECGFNATYYELHPEEETVTLTNKIDVSQFVEMRKKRDHVLAILRDTESILFNPVVLTALRFLIKGLEHRDKPTVFLGKEAMKNIETLRKASKKRPTLD